MYSDSLAIILLKPFKRVLDKDANLILESLLAGKFAYLIIVLLYDGDLFSMHFKFSTNLALLIGLVLIM